uniref:C-SKI_SMAD_bind domain-containing protein n=1 Tax=Mesocestoides corti TaxID=53468 RepID=A0A5K3ELM0_MESCO
MTQAASFSDKTSPMNPLMPRNLRRQIDGVTNDAPMANPFTALSFLPDSVRLPAEIEASYLNLLVLNSHILSPFARQLLLGNRNVPNLNPKRPIVPPPQPVLPNYSTQSGVAATAFPLPKPHEIEETGELVYSIVEGEKVMGFNVWGEVRLCLPHLLRFVLNDVDIDEIGQAISKLRIACTKCSPRQLATLHGCNALPSEVTSCGLIRKSDAERMLKFLRSARQRPTLADACPNADTTDGKSFVSERSEPRRQEGEREALLGTFIDVRHDCFGRQRGRVYPNLYTSATSPCILCRTCDKLFSPQDFVGHTHSVNESDSCCHWGFDSTNWRSYLQLDIDSISRQKKIKRESGDVGEVENPDVRTYRALKDFKVKFLKPLKLPNEIVKMLSKLEGNSGDYKCKSSSEPQPLDCSTTKPPTIPPSTTGHDVLRTATMAGRQTPDDALLEVRLRPNLRIRRLWAPHQGQLRIPNPPKLIANCPRGPKPRNLSSGPPVLLDPSCIVTKDSAQLYGRDFIPNVCLKPVATPASAASSGQQLSRSLPSVPSNEDLVSSAAEKRLSEADLFSDLKPPGGHLSRLVVRGSAMQLSTDSGLFQQSSHGLNSIDSSPARARHSSCVHDTTALNLLAPINFHKRCATEEVLRCPSVDSASVPFRSQINRTTSDPELNFSTTRSGTKRGRTGSWSLTPSSSSTSPSRRKRLLESSTAASAREDHDHTARSDETKRHQKPQEAPQQFFWSPPDSLPGQITPEMLLNLATDANPRIPNIASHWVSMLERIDQFCTSVAPSDDSAKHHFDAERQKLMMDLNVLREKNFADLSVVLKDNKKLWKLLTNALLLTGTSPPLTPNTLAPPFGVIPGVTDVDQITRMINLFNGLKSKFSLPENFRQSAPMENVELQSNDRTRLLWPTPSASYRSATPEMLPTARTAASTATTNGSDSPPTSNDFMPPSKRQRLFRHSYLASSNFNA